MKHLQRGLTLTELMITISIMMILLSVAYVNLFQPHYKFNLATNVDVLLSDLHGQQVKAMVGDTEGRGTNDYYGIHFETKTYTLFHGQNYVVNDSGNTIFTLAEGVQFSNVLFPSSKIVFQKGSGEVLNYSSNTNSFQIVNIHSGETKQIYINRYGVVTQIQ